MMARPGPFLVVTGPTGVGKTDLSISIAERIGAEIISADSRQVFKGISIGTAVPSPEALERVPHHFVQEKPLGTAWSAGRFAEEANARIAAVLERGSVPLIVGGSTLYLEALVYGLANVPPSDQGIRDELSFLAETQLGLEQLYRELQDVDPEAAASMDVTKKHRVVRALEVFRTTGNTLTSFIRERPRPPYSYNILVLSRPRDILYERINQRVDTMLAAGLLDENKRLLQDGHSLDQHPFKTIGYQEPQAYLQGAIGYDEMVSLLKRNSRRYAKRQLTWFRRWNDAIWVDLESENAESVITKAVDLVRSQKAPGGE